MSYYAEYRLSLGGLGLMKTMRISMKNCVLNRILISFAKLL